MGIDNYSDCIIREYHKIIIETKKAWFLDIVDDRELWFPKRACELDRKAHLVIVPEWLASKKWPDVKPLKVRDGSEPGIQETQFTTGRRRPVYFDVGPDLEDRDHVHEDPYEFH